MEELISIFVSLVLESSDDRDFHKRNSTDDEWRLKNDDFFEEQVDELRSQLEFKDVLSFVEAKLDNDDYSFSTAELQALSRNVDKRHMKHDVDVASPQTVAKIKDELTKEYGFKFQARTPPKHFRGSMSSGHGRHPFAGSGGGGSGFGSDMSGTSFTSFGGGPGAIGSGVEWSASDDKNLSMGSRRRK